MLPGRGKVSTAELQLRLRHALDDVNAGRSKAEGHVDAAFDILRSFDSLAGRLYKLRASRLKSDIALRRAEDFVAGVSTELLTLQSEKESESFYKEWVRGYRTIWKREFPLFFFTLILFTATGLLGWNIATRAPEFAPVLIPQSGMESVLEKEPWFERLQSGPLFYGMLIAWNNIRVAINSFILGALLGLGGLVVLCFNGLHFGSLLGYCYVNGFHEQLTEFVLGHGPLELTIIIASAFASLLYGRVFYMRPYRLFGKRMARGAKDAVYVITGILPWLVLAAAVEVFVSPFHYLSFAAKLLLGCLLAAAFWAWTFWPDPGPQKKAPR